MTTLYQAAQQHMAEAYDEGDWVWNGPVHNGPFKTLQELADEVDVCCRSVLTGDDNPDWTPWEGDTDALDSCLDDPEFLRRYKAEVNEDPAVHREIDQQLILTLLKHTA